MQDDRGTPTRGTVFTLVLFFLTLGHPVWFVLFCYYWQDLTALGMRVWPDAVIMLALAATAFVALVGVWRWRRWGVSLLGLIAVFSFVADLLTGVPLSAMGVRIGIFEVRYISEFFGLPNLPVVLATMILLIRAIYRRWQWFR